METTVRLLRSCEVLGGLDADELARVAALARPVKFAPDDVVFFQGDAPDGLYVVRKGEVRIVHHADDGREMLLNRLSPPAVFGEIALLDGSPRTATAIAATDTELLRLPRPAFLELLERRPALARELIRLLCRRIRTSGARLEEGALFTAPVRVARYLLRVAEVQGSPVPGGVRLGLHLPQATLGAAVGLSRQTVNEVLAELRDQGIIEVGRARITILDRAGLQRVAAGISK